MLLLVALASRARREGVLLTVPPATALAAVVGAEIYVVNMFRHANPIWPVRFDLGPLHFPGTHTTAELLASGANTPHPHGNLAWRVFDSWTTVFPPLAVFDMRVGGLGLVFLIALPFAVVGAVRARAVAVAMIAVASLAVPDPSVARFVLGFAGLVVAFAAPCIEHIRKPARCLVFSVVTLAAAHGVVVAYPGLRGEGPALTAYGRMDLAERQRAVGADGSPAPFLDAVANVHRGEITVFDGSAELPYYAWPFDLSRAAQRIPDDATAADVRRIVDDPAVRMLIVGDDTVAGAVVRADPRLVYEFHCRTGTCAVYLRRG